MANRFRDPRGDPNAKAVFMRDSEGLQSTRHHKYIATRKRKLHTQPDRPGDLSPCPRWALLRQRIRDKAKLAVE